MIYKQKRTLYTCQDYKYIKGTNGTSFQKRRRTEVYIYIREGDLNLATAITSDDLSFVVT